MFCEPSEVGVEDAVRKFPEAVITKSEQGKRRRGRRLEQRVEWRWMRSGR